MAACPCCRRRWSTNCSRTTALRIGVKDIEYQKAFVDRPRIGDGALQRGKPSGFQFQCAHAFLLFERYGIAAEHTKERRRPLRLAGLDLQPLGSCRESGDGGPCLHLGEHVA